MGHARAECPVMLLSAACDAGLCLPMHPSLKVVVQGGCATAEMGACRLGVIGTRSRRGQGARVTERRQRVRE